MSWLFARWWQLGGFVKGKLLAISLFTLGLALPVWAHHSHSNIDREDIRVHSGIVSEYNWSMPHVFLRIMAPNQDGQVVEYTIEFLHPPGMVERGWSPETFQVGERITWEGASDRNPKRYFTSMSWAERADGTRVDYGFGGERKAAVLPSKDFTGLWKRSRSFGSTYAPPPGLPLTEVGQALFDNFNPRTNPQVDCMEPGPPRFTILPYPIQITRPDEKTVVLKGELRHEPRVVHLDMDYPVGPPSHLGHSVGWFEGKELIVETTNFTQDRWGTHAGIDSSDQKHLIERYSMNEDGLMLKVLMTVTDPIYLAQPIEIDYSMDKQPDRQLVTAPCSLEGARLFLTGYKDE
tara:strand:+ start:287 stop:1333 length:1047 start_codon:yes stop_codon:yes gene_type:complete